MTLAAARRGIATNWKTGCPDAPVRPIGDSNPTRRAPEPVFVAILLPRPFGDGGRVAGPAPEQASFPVPSTKNEAKKKRMMGLEPTTFCMASRRSSQLSYIREAAEV